jgi:glutamate-ammonia-ligase adenylyltransferase
MRLRPSGSQGPVATSWASFVSYQREEAWTWEHLALTRAQVIAGPEDLAEDVEAFRREVLALPRDLTRVAADVADMRARIRSAKSPASLWEVKVGPGRLQDIELIAQTGALLGLGRAEDTDAGLQAAQTAGLLDAEGAQVLRAAKRFYSDVLMAVRLLSEAPLEASALGPAGRSFLLRSLQAESLEALEERLQDSYAACDRIISAALAPYRREEEAK